MFTVMIIVKNISFEMMKRAHAKDVSKHHTYYFHKQTYLQGTILNKR